MWTWKEETGFRDEETVIFYPKTIWIVYLDEINFNLLALADCLIKQTADCFITLTGFDTCLIKLKLSIYHPNHNVLNIDFT